jgi:hypothetical protein
MEDRKKKNKTEPHNTMIYGTLITRINRSNPDKRKNSRKAWMSFHRAVQQGFNRLAGYHDDDQEEMLYFCAAETKS